MEPAQPPTEPAQPEESSCCCTATAMEEEVQISEDSDPGGASEDERSPPQSAHSGKRRGGAARASVIRNRIIQKKYLQRKKVPLLASSCQAAARTFTQYCGVIGDHQCIIHKRLLQCNKVPGFPLPSHTLHLESCAENLALQGHACAQSEVPKADFGGACPLGRVKQGLSAAQLSPAVALQWLLQTHARLQGACADPACPRMQDQRTALLESVMELEAQRAELRAEMQPLWARHQSLTQSLPPCLQQV